MPSKLSLSASTGDVVPCSLEMTPPFTTYIPAGTIWDELDVEIRETDSEVEEYERRVKEEVQWKVEGGSPSGTPGGRQEDPARPVDELEPLNVEVSPDADASIGVEHVRPIHFDTSLLPKPPSSKILASLAHTIDRVQSTPHMSRLTGHSTLPSVPTPKDQSTPLPAPLHRANTSRFTNQTMTTPDFVASPLDTPELPKVGEPASSPSRTGSNAEEGTPRPLGSGVFASLKGKKDYQTLTKHFQDFSKTVAKRDAAVNRSVGKGRGGKSANAVPGLGGRVFVGLRFCMPPELGQVNKHKHRWDIVSVIAFRHGVH